MKSGERKAAETPSVSAGEAGCPFQAQLGMKTETQEHIMNWYIYSLKDSCQHTGTGHATQREQHMRHRTSCNECEAHAGVGDLSRLEQRCLSVMHSSLGTGSPQEAR